MANLIRLKQIESGSYLNTAATIGQDFSQSVIDIVTGEIVGALPDGIISSSTQVDLLQTTNFIEFSSSISNSFVGIYTELASITGSIESGLSASVATSFSQSNSVFNIFSASVHTQISASNTIFTQFSSSISSEISASSANTINISSSVNTRLNNLESFSSSLDNGFATDAELTVTSSQIIDQGEW
jgi:hypothetical protein